MNEPIAAWQRPDSYQTMNWTNRRTPLPLLVAAQSFVWAGVSAIEEISAPDVPSEINMDVRRFWFLSIREFVRNWDSIVDAVHQGIGWIRELLLP